MRRRKKKQTKIIIIISITLLFVLTTGYAAFSTNLNITAKGNVKNLSAADYLRKECNQTSGDGLYKDIYDENRCVYKGSNPNNYITFNNETWRILSVENDDTLKIIKAKSIGDMAFDSQTNLNNWKKPASLNTYLNNTYYNSLSETAKNQIQKHDWNIGAVEEHNNINLLEYTIEQERQETWNGNIALITISDFIKADSDTDNCNSIQKNQNNANWDNAQNSTCWNTNYIANSILTTTTNVWMWLLTPRSNTPSSLWRLRDYHYLHVSEANNQSIGVIPATHLNSKIKLSGQGTSTNPYKIS